MKEIKVFVVGSNIDGWIDKVKEYCFDRGEHISFINPSLYKDGMNDRAFISLISHLIHDCDVAIVNTNDFDDMASYELGVINGINSHGEKFIFTIGIGNKREMLPVHAKESILHFEQFYEDAIDFIGLYF